MILGLGLHIGGKGGWTPASISSKILFWGVVSEISGGQMLNKITGASDYLTVTGDPDMGAYEYVP